MSAPSKRVIATAAEATGRSATALAPLYCAIDPEALDDFVRSAPPGSELAFEYADRAVEITTTETGLSVSLSS